MRPPLSSWRYPWAWILLLFLLFVSWQLVTWQSLTCLQQAQDLAQTKSEQSFGVPAAPQLQVSNHYNNATTVDPCQLEFDRVVTSSQTPGLTEEDVRRSRAWVGNEQALARLWRKLEQGNEPVNIMATGGSITLGHGVLLEKPHGRYPGQLEWWLQDYFPGQPHQVFMQGGHGADMCSMAKRVNSAFERRYRNQPKFRNGPDLVILEFGVNDYEGQEETRIREHSDVFFKGFEEKVVCAEAVVQLLRKKYPQAAIMFLEFQSAMLSRRTAQLLHLGVAQHYQLPVISYAEAMMPGYFRLIKALEPSGYLKPVNDTVLDYPHGCGPCLKEDMINQFVNQGCRHLCGFMRDSGRIQTCNAPPAGMEHCHLPMFAHDNVHPSRVGHGIAKDLIVHAIASAGKRMCQKQYPSELVMPPATNYRGSQEELYSKSNFVFVHDTMHTFAAPVPLESTNFSGFALLDDGPAWRNRPGWISDNPRGGDFVQFKTLLPHGCYILYLATLKSYVGMGTFTIRMTDVKTQKSFEAKLDGLWEAQISVPHDVPIFPPSKDFACTGTCTLTVIADPQTDPTRKGNKVKITTFSARTCQDADFFFSKVDEKQE